MSDEKNINKVGISAKARLVVAVIAIVGVVGGISAIWYHHHKKMEEVGTAYVTGGPNIKSIPGAGNPSNQYVNTQNLQNKLNAVKARKAGTSSIPTITRPSFVGNPDEFGIIPKTTSGSTAPKSCAIKKTVVLFQPNPANCSVDNLKKARDAGVTAEELACQACPLSALRAAGYTAGELKNVGYSAAQLKAAGYGLNDLVAAGFNAKQLKAAGFEAKQLKDKGFVAGQLASAGYTHAQLQQAGFGLDNIAGSGIINPNCNVTKLTKERKSGVTVAGLKNEGCGVAALRAAGFSPAQIAKSGLSPEQLKNAGYTAGQLKSAGYTAAQLKYSGFTPEQLKAAGFTADQLKKAGYSAADLKMAGYSDAALKSAGFTPSQIKAADKIAKECSVSQLKRERASGVSALELKKRGCGLAGLAAAGFTAGELKAAGFSAKELKDAGYSAGDLRAAGFNASALKAAGYSAAALKAAGYSANALKGAGYSADALKAAGFSASALKDAGFSASELRGAGYSAAALKAAGYSAKALKSAGFNAGDLASAQFSPKELHDAGFSVKQMRKAGFNAADLKQAGYAASDLQAAGYTKGDLLRAGFKAKVAGYPSPEAAVQSEQKAGLIKNDSTPQADGASLTPEERLAKMVRDQQSQLSAQNRDDAVQQMQGAMSMQAQSMVTEWGNNQQQSLEKADIPAATANTGAGSTGSAQSGTGAGPVGKILKAGSVMYAVLDTSINSDEKSPILATIVDGPLNGSKLLGQFSRVNQRLLLSFTLLNDPHYYKSIPLNSVAIDPDTARTAISGQVNNHYLLKYGMTFGTAFLSGISDAVLQSNSSPQCSLFGCVKTVKPLNTKQQITVGIGTAGKQIATDFGSQFANMPPTVKIKGGTGIGILLMSDLQLPVGAIPSKDSGE